VRAPRARLATLLVGIVFVLGGAWGLYALLYEDSPVTLAVKVRANDVIERVAGARPFDETSFLDTPTIESTAASSARETNVKLVPLFTMRIPKIGRAYTVYEGVSAQVLARGPGHIPGTAYPWFRGNTGVSGHRVTHGAPFRLLDRLEKGDAIIVHARGKTMIFAVVWKKRVRPSNTSVLATTTQTALTLTTCDPPFSARYRLVVRAVLTETREE
jgi:LPXTG-site transpeptidase (sortase) family protein